MADNQDGNPDNVAHVSSFWLNDEGWQIAWPAAIAFAMLFHAVAFVAGNKAPPKVVHERVVMAISMPPPPPPPPPPEPPPPPPEPVEKPKPKPLPKEDLPPPPNETPPEDVKPPEEVVPVTGVTADSVVAESASGIQTRVGNTTFGDQNKEEFTPPTEVQKPAARPFDLDGYRKRVFDAMNKEKRYPRKARVLGLEGKCVVKVMINRDGSLAGPPKLLGKGTGHQALDEECLRLAGAIQYEPIDGDVEVPLHLTRAISFTLMDP